MADERNISFTARSRDFVGESKNFSFRGSRRSAAFSIGAFLFNKVMTLPARNRNVYKRFVAFINHERDKGRGTEIAFT